MTDGKVFYWIYVVTQHGEFVNIDTSAYCTDTVEPEQLASNNGREYNHHCPYGMIWWVGVKYDSTTNEVEEIYTDPYKFKRDYYATK